MLDYRTLSHYSGGESDHINGGSDWWEKESSQNGFKSTIQRRGYPFRPTRLIVLSELSTKKKEYYYKLLLGNRAKFAPDGEGRFIANVRLMGPDVKKSEVTQLTTRDYRKFVILNILNTKFHT